MSALRWAGALMLALCGWCVGDALAQKLQAEVDALEDTVHLLEDIREEIAFRRQDLGRLRERLTREGRLRTRNSKIQTALPPPGHWANGKRHGSMPALPGWAVRKPSRSVSGWSNTPTNSVRPWPSAAPSCSSGERFPAGWALPLGWRWGCCCYNCLEETTWTSI